MQINDPSRRSSSLSCGGAPGAIGRRKCSAKDGRYSQAAEALIKFAFAVDRPLFLFGSILCASHQLSDLNNL
jgi:hypothetical protein